MPQITLTLTDTEARALAALEAANAALEAANAANAAQSTDAWPIHY